VQAAEALEHAHQLGIVHRDIKPANLLIDHSPLATQHSPRLWITDFGLAHCQGQAGLTMSGDLVGTLRYMSPEQALAKRVLVDHRTDVYSLGATLYELLTLQPAFAGGDRQELLRQIAFEDPKPLRRLNKAIPAELETIILKALEKNPADRYATAQDLADELGRYLKNEPIRAKRPSLLMWARKFALRHKPVVTTVGAALLLFLVVLGGGVGWVVGDRAAQRAKAAQRFDDALGHVLALMENENWPDANAAAQLAAVILESEGADELRLQRLRRIEADLDMVAKVESTRLKQGAIREAAALKGEKFDTSAAARDFAEIFGNYDLPLLEMEAEAAAQRIAHSLIRAPVLAAVADWAEYTGDLTAKEKLSAILRLAARTPWRQQMFEVVKLQDWPALARLTQEPSSFRQDPADLLVLGNLIAQTDRPRAIEFLKQAQQRHPNDPWINLALAEHLTKMKPASMDEAIGYFRAALALRPTSPAVHRSLGNALCERGALAEAEAQFREAIDLKPDYADAYSGLGDVLHRKGRLDEAIAKQREALRHDKANYLAQTGLGNALVDKALEVGDKGLLDEGIGELRQALQLSKGEGFICHNNLGRALYLKGLVKEALTEYEEAIRLNRDDARVHLGLGLALDRMGEPDRALAAYQEAVRLKPDLAEAHNSLGIALGNKGRLDEAIGAFQLAVHFKPAWGSAHKNLGLALEHKGRLDEAVVAFTEAVRLMPNNANTWALERARELIQLNTRLGKVLSGESQPNDAVERVKLAHLCVLPFKRLTATAARFYAEAFAAEPKLADDLAAQHRYDAACAAALAAAGQGKDAEKLDAEEQIRLRRQALDWLRADLALWIKQGEHDSPQIRAAVQSKLGRWQQDNDLASVRDEKALAKLPADEQPGWRRLWADVEQTLAKARERTNGKEKSKTKP
jgi:tetratricopeptide (TPR) repeat protein